MSENVESGELVIPQNNIERITNSCTIDGETSDESKKAVNIPVTSNTTLPPASQGMVNIVLKHLISGDGNLKFFQINHRPTRIRAKRKPFELKEPSNV